MYYCRRYLQLVDPWALLEPLPCAYQCARCCEKYPKSSALLGKRRLTYETKRVDTAGCCDRGLTSVVQTLNTYRDFWVPSYWALFCVWHRTGSWLPWSPSSSTVHKGFLIWPFPGSVLSSLATSSLRLYTPVKPQYILLFTQCGSTVQLPQLCSCYFLFPKCFLSSMCGSTST